jgi:hypothetical protein
MLMQCVTGLVALHRRMQFSMLDLQLSKLRQLLITLLMALPKERSRALLFSARSCAAGFQTDDAEEADLFHVERCSLVCLGKECALFTY